ncbi:MAG: cupin domain-containing protein [Nannocystaceae bacterium]|nr:cupin domain-containing protein [Myxococcales bacterium]
MAKDYRWALMKSGEGETINGTTIKIRSDQLGGDFSVMEADIAPHQLLTPHTHLHEDQGVYVIEGELEFEVGGEGGTRFTARAGDYVVKPRGVSHCFWNTTDQTARYIELSGRANFEAFVYETKESTAKASLLAKQKHGVTFHSERIPKLLKEHGLTSVAGTEMPWEGAGPPPWHKAKG